MNTDADTKTLANLSGYTSSTSAESFMSTMSLTKSMAHKLLNEVKAGIYHPPLRVTQALITTGDWHEK